MHYPINDYPRGALGENGCGGGGPINDNPRGALSGSWGGGGGKGIVADIAFRFDVKAVLPAVEINPIP